MRNLLKTLAVIAAVAPAVSFAAIKNSKHDLASGSTAAVKSADTDQTCVFCHTPHRAAAQSLIWNRKDPTAVGFSGTQITIVGTELPGTVRQPSKACLSCHDGSIALGDVNSVATATPAGTPFAVAALANRVAAGALIGNTKVAGADLDNNHPVSIPYAQEAGTYNGKSSLAKVGAGFFRAASSAACTTYTGHCVTGVEGADFILYKETAAGARGIECGSCHDVHNRKNNGTKFLWTSNAQSALCVVCHDK